MANDDPDPDVGLQDEDPSIEGAGQGPAQGPHDHEAAEQAPEDRPSWLGCLWLVVIPGIILTAVVITLNWLGC